MKIITIRIKNLASLEGVTEIDFTQEPLSSAGIFAITGPTGSGKSTILDALCLALYARTPRYVQARESGIVLHDVQGSTINQSDVRGILRDGTADGFAEVDFIGVDRQQYRASWNVKRAHNKITGSIQNFTIALKNISTNTDIPGKKTELQNEIEHLVGLNFEQFTRSVLLAQGDFSAFLKANKDEKSELLEKLTGTQIYSEISRRIFEKHRDEAQELKDLNLQRTGIVTLTTEEIAALDIRKNELELAVANHEKEVEQLGKEIAWYKQLEGLASNLAAAVIIVEQATAAKKQAAERELKLKQVEKVQPARTWVEGLHTAEIQLTDKAVYIKQLEESLRTLGKEKEVSDLSVQNANVHLITTTNAQEEAQPSIDSAKALDVQVKEKGLQVSTASDEVVSIQKKQKQHQDLLNEKQQQAKELQQNIEQLTQWKEENSSRQLIADHQNLIISKLSDAGSLLKTLETLTSKSVNAQDTIRTTTLEKSTLDNQYIQLTEKITIDQRAYEYTSAEISAVSIVTLEKDKSEADTLVEDVVRAEAHWKSLFATQKDLTALQQKQAKDKEELVTKKEAFDKATEQLNTIFIQRDTSRTMLDRARMVATENVETLRLQLKPEQPCPVCGSNEHPYVAHNPQLDRVLAELETTHKKNEAAYAGCLKTHSSLEQNCDQLQGLINAQEKTLVLKASALKELENVWSKFVVYNECVSIADEQKEQWLNGKVQTQKTEQLKIQKQIQSYYKQKEELNTQKAALDVQQKKLTEVTNAIKDCERTLQSMQEQLEQYGRELSKTTTDLAAIENILAPYFVAQDWFDKWKANPGTFVAHINDFSEQWKTQTKTLVEKSGQQHVLAATISGEQKQAEQLSEEVRNKEKILSDTTVLYDALIEKRNVLFNGEEISKVEAGFRQSVEKARQALDACKAANEQLQKDSIKIGTQRDGIEKEITSLKEQASSFADKIAEWLNQYAVQQGSSLTETELKELLTFSPAWVDSERAGIRSIDDALTQAQSILQERTATLETHKQAQVSERALDALETLLIETKAALQQDVELKNEINLRLRYDETNKEKIGGLLATIEAKALIVENWAKLNDVIGSADGKKFRQIAQEYTLDVLLSYANVHLEMLSKRYLLQRIPGTLALQVLDQDMGDEIRTVYSLSGGESFLVSLALALGLASLSSSSMKVESLFIDEGFGSLDPVTLNIAMDALERLHNQGRKVGVISHVQEMTERIPVQIRVSKQQSGKSVVEVMGN